MRTTPVAIAFAGAGRDATMDAARRVSLLTHGDPAAGEGCAIFCELVRVALEGGDPLAAIVSTLDLVDEQARDGSRSVLDESWQPDGVEPNGAVWGALGTAVWALRRASSFAEAVVLAIDTGDDADTVGCITGGLAGAVYGIGAIPSRWASPIHGSVVGQADSGYDLASLRDLAAELAGLDRDTPPDLPTWSPRGPHLVDERGLWVADREGAVAVARSRAERGRDLVVEGRPCAVAAPLASCLPGRLRGPGREPRARSSARRRAQHGARRASKPAILSSSTATRVSRGPASCSARG